MDTCLIFGNELIPVRLAGMVAVGWLVGMVAMGWMAGMVRPIVPMAGMTMKEIMIPG